MSFLGLLRTLHAWSGAVLSVVLIIVGLSGAILVLRQDIVRLTVPEARAPADLSPQTVGAILEAQERRHPGALRAFVASGSGLHHLYHADGSSLLSQGGEEVRSSAVEATEALVRLHQDLFAGQAGDRLVGFSGIAAVILVLTGLVVWAPAWRSFRLRVWPAVARRSEMVSVHRNIGVLFAVPIVFFCATGAAIAFGETTGKVLARALPQVTAPPPAIPPAGTGDIDWPRALAQAQARFPDAELALVYWPGWPGGPATVRFAQPGEWLGADQAVVLIDPATSGVLFAADRESAPLGAVVRGAFDPLHAAAVGGRLYDVVAFLSGLTLAALGVLGLWSFLIKPRRRVRKVTP